MTTHDVRPPDLEMQVRTLSEHGRTRLMYTLHSPTGAVSFAHREIAGPTLQGSPEEFQGHFLRKIEQLGARQDVDGSPLLRAELDRKLASLGRDLWRELIPSEIRHVYREIRRSVHSWMIVSDEPWIPWELIKPYDASRPDDIVDDDFLALRFELTRWLAGNKTPARHISVRSLAAFRTAAGLPHAEQERSVLTEIVQSRSTLLDATPRANSAGEVLSFLETGSVELLHFIGHGTYTAAQTEESGIPFLDGSVLRPVDLEGPLATRIGATRPLVFLNACWAGQQGWSLTLLGGWASRWVSVCGCGAFVAPMWPARDKAALSFAGTFYAALDRGATLGRAALEARRQVAQDRPGDPSALAYAVYGHPNARLWFGEGFPSEICPSQEASPVIREPILPLVELPRQPWSAFRSRKAWIAAASVVLCLLLASPSGWIHELWNLGDSPSRAASPTADKSGPKEPGQVPVAVPVKMAAEERSDRKSPANPAAPPLETTRSSRTTSTGTAEGIAFEIAAASGVPKSTLKGALRSVAAPLAGMGISGWTLHLDVEAPRVTPHTQDGLSRETCRLVAHCSARAQGSSASLDLGTASVANAQDDGATACEEAAQGLAKDVIYRLVSSIRKGKT